MWKTLGSFWAQMDPFAYVLTPETAHIHCGGSGLALFRRPQEYSGPILALIFLRFAEVRFAAQRAKLEKANASSRRGSRVDEPAAYHADNVLYLAPEARFDHLLTLPEAVDIGGKVNAAMREVEKHNPQLACVLPKPFHVAHDDLSRQGVAAHLRTASQDT
jgi:type I restriction-modification system DNA methylase subunit